MRFEISVRLMGADTQDSTSSARPRALGGLLMGLEDLISALCGPGTVAASSIPSGEIAITLEPANSTDAAAIALTRGVDHLASFFGALGRMEAFLQVNDFRLGAELDEPLAFIQGCSRNPRVTRGVESLLAALHHIGGDLSAEVAIDEMSTTIGICSLSFARGPQVEPLIYVEERLALTIHGVTELYENVTMMNAFYQGGRSFVVVCGDEEFYRLFKSDPARVENMIIFCEVVRHLASDFYKPSITRVISSVAVGEDPASLDITGAGLERKVPSADEDAD